MSTKHRPTINIDPQDVISYPCDSVYIHRTFIKSLCNVFDRFGKGTFHPGIYFAYYILPPMICQGNAYMEVPTFIRRYKLTKTTAGKT